MSPTYKIIQNGEVINIIVADEEFCKTYCTKNGYTYELIPESEEPEEPKTTLEDRVTALETAIEKGLSL